MAVFRWGRRDFINKLGQVYEGQQPSPTPYNVIISNNGIKNVRIEVAGSDIIRLIGSPIKVIDAVRAAITSSWGPIQKETECFGAHEFKLTGYPFLGVNTIKLAAAVCNALAPFTKKYLLCDEKLPKPSSHNVVEAINGIQMCSILLNGSNLIRLIGLSIEVIDAVRAAITSSWGEIQKESDHHGAYEFKLNGRPWRGGQDIDVIERHRLLVAILKTMAQLGWNLSQASGVDNASSINTGTLCFEKGIADPNVDLFAISFPKGRIHIIDAPLFVACVTNALNSQKNIVVQNRRECHGLAEYKLFGYPLHQFYGRTRIDSQVLLCQIIANIRAKGYKLYGTVDVPPGWPSFGVKNWIFRRIGPAWNSDPFLQKPETPEVLN